MSGAGRRLVRIAVAVLLWVGAACAPAILEAPRRAYQQGDYATALAGWRSAAEQGHPEALTALGLMYVRGHGVPQDDAEAVRWLARAAALGDAAGQFHLALAHHLGRGVPRDDATSAAWARRAAEQGHPDAQAHLGYLFFAGRGVPRDDREALRWTREAAGQGHLLAQRNLGVAYLDGRGVAEDGAEAVRWVRRAAAGGDAGAQAMLGAMYRDGRGLPPSDIEAVRWFRRAAEGGHAGAYRQLGLAYQQGRGVPRDGTESHRLLRYAAERGDAHAQAAVGQQYRQGEGVPRDAATAAAWFRRAAGQGHASAQRGLGLLYLEGQGVPQSDAEAASWLRQAAAQGDVTAQVNLGVLHYTGRGVPQDHAEGVRWFRRAAGAGNPTAQRNLGISYLGGIGVPRDEAEAATWLGRAAEQGDRPAQLRLGAMYEHGVGVPPDPVQAHVWYSLAAEGPGQGPGAATLRALLARTLTPDQLARAQALEAAWRARRSPAPAAPLAPPDVFPSPGDGPAGPAADLIPRRALFLPAATRPRLSPDGRRLAYLAPVEEILNVRVRTVEGQDDRPVTAERHRGIGAYRWQCDGAHILYPRDRDGDERWHLHQVAVESGVTRDLTPLEGARVELVALDCRHPEHALLAIDRRTPGVPDVHRIHLPSGALELDTANPGDVLAWKADGELRVRAALGAHAGRGSVLRVRADAGSRWREVPGGSAAALLAFTADGRGLDLLASGDGGTTRLVRLDVGTGRATTTLAGDPHHDVASVLFHPGTEQVQAVAVDRPRRTWTAVDASLVADLEALRAASADDFEVISRDLPDRTWVVRYSRDDTPPRYYLYDRARRATAHLFDESPALEGTALARMEPIEFPARDGLNVRGFLTLPVIPATRAPRPLVVLVHGGPWDHDVWGWNPVVQWLANRGYAVLQVNFRGSTGHGVAHREAGNREWGGRMLTDLVDGKAWAVRAGHADPSRACVMGSSYGGYAALSAVTFAPDEFACGISFAGPSDLVALLRSRSPLSRLLWGRRVGRPEEDQAFLESRSPLLAVERIRAPLLIAHGANDRNVSRLESDLLVAAARARGAPVEYLVFPGEGHSLTGPRSRLRFFAAVERFLAQHLGGRAEAPAPDEDWRALRR